MQVTSAEPEIRVNRAESAEVAIAQADANVEIEQEGEANVQVSEAEPEVNVEQAEGADVTVDQADPNIQIEDEGEADVTMDADAETDGAMYADFDQVMVSDIVGMNVLTEEGEDVGEIDSLVTANGEIFAVVGVGGFLGLGERDVAIPLDRFMMQDDALVLSSVTESELEGMTEYDDSAEAVPLDVMVGDAY